MKQTYCSLSLPPNVSMKIEHHNKKHQENIKFNYLKVNSSRQIKKGKQKLKKKPTGEHFPFIYFSSFFLSNLTHRGPLMELSSRCEQLKQREKLCLTG
jgi:hypothetical protein